MARKKSSQTKAIVLADIPICELRSVRVLLDSDLAALYGVTTKRLNEAVKRNAARFPGDFRFQLTEHEWAGMRSQIATGSQRHRDPRFRPFAFTEHGALQAANVLKSKRAIAMSVYVIRAFVQMREQLATSATILKRLAEIDKTLLEHDERVIWRELQPLLNPSLAPPKPRIGFKP